MYLGIDSVKNLCVCPLRAEHLPAVASLETACFADPWSEQALAVLLSPENVGFVIMDGAQALAYGGMTTVLDEGTVTNIATHPDARRQGLGRQIVSSLLREAETRGLEKVFLEVRVSNEAAWRLYEQMNFSRVGLRKNFYRHPTEDAFIMEWSRDEAVR